MKIDTDDDDALAVGIEDLKPSVVQRLLKNVVMRNMRRSRPRFAKNRNETPDLDDSEEEGESENDKLVALNEEKRGKPAPIPASESDFAEGTVRRAMKALPKTSRKR
jgi:hypothetical protein